MNIINFLASSLERWDFSYINLTSDKTLLYDGEWNAVPMFGSEGEILEWLQDWSKFWIIHNIFIRFEVTLIAHKIIRFCLYAPSSEFSLKKMITIVTFQSIVYLETFIIAITFLQLLLSYFYFSLEKSKYLLNEKCYFFTMKRGFKFY